MNTGAQTNQSDRTSAITRDDLLASASQDSLPNYEEEYLSGPRTEITEREIYDDDDKSSKYIDIRSVAQPYIGSGSPSFAIWRQDEPRTQSEVGTNGDETTQGRKSSLANKSSPSVLKTDRMRNVIGNLKSKLNRRMCYI
ncbi:uncharacterized protein L201_002496 [Kwoniella dendrophila CBS 6074]|uniref:Uncharacterized protein n=1 Tax=Kwoniella dendrophila CBS 6074 TaxID=1295534 RepID=A0AAX4JR87_9TREE